MAGLSLRWDATEPAVAAVYRKVSAAASDGCLTYFEDAEQEPELRMLMPLNWEEVKRDLLTAVGALLP